MWTNQRAAVRIWEFLFPPLLLERYVRDATFRKVFLYPSLCGENMSETIELCSILTFWRSWIPFNSYAEVKFRVLQRAWKECRCWACSKQPQEKKICFCNPWASFIPQSVLRQSYSHGLVGHLHITFIWFFQVFRTFNPKHKFQWLVVFTKKEVQMAGDECSG